MNYVFRIWVANWKMEENCDLGWADNVVYLFKPTYQAKRALDRCLTKDGNTVIEMSARVSKTIMGWAELGSKRPINLLARYIKKYSIQPRMQEILWSFLVELGWLQMFLQMDCIVHAGCYVGGTVFYVGTKLFVFYNLTRNCLLHYITTGTGTVTFIGNFLSFGLRIPQPTQVVCTPKWLAVCRCGGRDFSSYDNSMKWAASQCEMS